MSAIMGTFVKIGTMADGTPRIVLDLQCGLADVAAMGLIPGVPFAIARLTKEAAGKPVTEPEAPKEKPGQLCVMACTFCADPMFRKWISETYKYECQDEGAAKEFVLEICGIESRKELDTDSRAAFVFHERVRKPFVAWKADQDARRAA
jgi:hypothetical protein